MIRIAINKQFPFAAFGAFLIDYGVKLGSFQHSNFEKAKFVNCFGACVTKVTRGRA